MAAPQLPVNFDPFSKRGGLTVFDVILQRAMYE